MKRLLSDRKSIYNPFKYIAGERALLLGAGIILLSALAGYYSNTWLDGILDMHYGPEAPFHWHLAMGLINWLSLLIVLAPLAYILTDTKIRLVDLAGTFAMARLPMLIAVLTGFFNAPARVSRHIIYIYLEAGEPVELSVMDYGLTVLLLIVVLIMIIWQVALLFNAYKLCANLKQNRAAISFTAGFVIAYVVSKLLIAWLQNLLL